MWTASPKPRLLDFLALEDGHEMPSSSFNAVCCKCDWRLNKLLQSLDCSATASPEHFLLYKLRVRGRGCREIGDSQRGVHATILARSGLCDVPFLA